MLKKKKPRNKFEKRIHSQLKRARIYKVDDDGNRVASKIIFTYEEERIAYILARHYSPDFILYTKSGKIYIECKGYFRPEDKAKMLAVKRQHPNKDIRILFYSKNDKYIKWCEKNGYRYAIERIPKSWFTE